MLAELPKIDKRGRIVILEKGSRRVVQKTSYARYEDIEAYCRPVLARHGFILTHRTEARPNGGLNVTGVLTHRGPHGVYEETATLPLPPDPSGSKNDVQAVGSAMTYGRRYTTTALLNLIFEDEDTDGRPPETPQFISDLQILEIENALRGRRRRPGALPARLQDRAYRRPAGRAL